MLNTYALNTRAINARGSVPLRTQGLVSHMSMAGELRSTLSATLSGGVRIDGKIIAYPVACLPISGGMSMSGELRPALSAALGSAMTMAGSVRWRAQSDIPPTAVAYVLAIDRVTYVKEVI